MDSFRGDLKWVHKWEGHLGKPYWPKGQSGITLDPGVDLGYIDWALFERSYADLLSAEQLADLRKYAGLKGESAGQALEKAFAEKSPFTTIRIKPEDGDRLFALVAEPYWAKISGRFQTLANATTPAVVHTVFLSLAYNRGPNNKDFETLRPALESQNWRGVGQGVAAMQQDHKLEGIRRRRREEGQLILDSVAS